MIGYRPGSSVLHRIHPYTPLSIAAAILFVAFAVETPVPMFAIVIVAVGFAIVGESLGYAARPALVLALPTWILLLILHGVFGDAPYIMMGPVRFSEPGLDRALVLGGRLTAILFAFLTVLGTVSPARLVEAMTEREVSFSTTYLLVSTLTLIPRMRRRAAQILEAQQSRGLRLGGSPFARVMALGPLVLPLVMGALAEVDEQVLALDSRGVAKGHRRTAMDPPPDTAAEFAVRWLCTIVVVGAWARRTLEILL